MRAYRKLSVSCGVLLGPPLRRFLIWCTAQVGQPGADAVFDRPRGTLLLLPLPNQEAVGLLWLVVRRQGGTPLLKQRPKFGPGHQRRFLALGALPAQVVDGIDHGRTAEGTGSALAGIVLRLRRYIVHAAFLRVMHRRHRILIRHLGGWV